VIADKKEAVALEQESRVVRAVDHVDNLIIEVQAKASQEPDNPLYQRELGKLYGQKGNYEIALQYLEKIFAGEAGNDPTLEKEINDIKAKSLQAEITQKKAALATNPGGTALEQEIAALDFKLGELQLHDMERLVERYPNDLMYRYDLGVLYLKISNTQAAIEQFQKSVGQPQRRVASLNFLGQCFEREGLHDIAVDQYLKALEEIPQMDGVKKDITYNLGNCYETLGQHDKALIEFKKIVSVDIGYKDVRQRITHKPPQK
jgi:tetratricopeptide (TPR) repeat protein